MPQHSGMNFDDRPMTGHQRPRSRSSKAKVTARRREGGGEKTHADTSGHEYLHACRLDTKSCLNCSASHEQLAKTCSIEQLGDAS